MTGKRTPPEPTSGLIAAGMLVQAAALGLVAATHSFAAWALAAVLLGAGTAMVYPTLLAAVGDVAHPAWRARRRGLPALARWRIRRRRAPGRAARVRFRAAVFVGQHGRGRPLNDAGLDPVPPYRVHARCMRTSEVAARARVNPQTLRYYERRGLLPEPERSASGYRAYGPQAVRLVRFIKRAQDLGFTLDDIELLLHLSEGGPEGCDAARELATAKISDLDARIADLQAMREGLARLVQTCEQPRERRHCPILVQVGGDEEDSR